MSALSGILRRPGQRAAAKPQSIKRGKGETALPYAMVAPLLVFICALALYPTIKTVYGAFVHNDALDPPTHFAGFAQLPGRLQQLAGPRRAGEHRASM